MIIFKKYLFTFTFDIFSTDTEAIASRSPKLQVCIAVGFSTLPEQIVESEVDVDKHLVLQKECK